MPRVTKAQLEAQLNENTRTLNAATTRMEQNRHDIEFLRRENELLKYRMHAWGNRLERVVGPNSGLLPETREMESCNPIERIMSPVMTRVEDFRPGVAMLPAINVEVLNRYVCTVEEDPLRYARIIKIVETRNHHTMAVCVSEQQLMELGVEGMVPFFTQKVCELLRGHDPQNRPVEFNRDWFRLGGRDRVAITVHGAGGGAGATGPTGWPGPHRDGHAGVAQSPRRRGRPRGIRSLLAQINELGEETQGSLV